MTYSVEAGWFPDVNVWIAIASDRHLHHDAARRWFSSAVAPVYFCRVTQMAFLRLLTNPKVMAGDSLSPTGAIAIYRQLAEDERVRYAPEPSNVEEVWISLMRRGAGSGGAWTDAYLAAFALERHFRLITFDKGMRNWPMLALQVLTPD